MDKLAKALTREFIRLGLDQPSRDAIMRAVLENTTMVRAEVPVSPHIREGEEVGRLAGLLDAEGLIDKVATSSGGQPVVQASVWVVR